MMYNKIVRDCFFSPKHVGVVDLNDQLAVVVKNNQKGQGVIELYMQCNPDDTIVKACFKTNGNPYIIASLEWLCRQLEGMSIMTAPQIDYQLIVKELDIPVAQYPIALRIVDVYKEVLFLMKKINRIER
ncbi:iron-sulfur cluster assembly scaffold protein [Fluoribacter gormanii]|uniref:Nitrogen fixation protein NifU n=1 Tax=Fluoribacter gormanii TaxID=464 RepID=A0A377GIG3_9GAMM|nr:iron-sulfur cluster assembly scaffold protein [Fluoribacter gormanii]KTD03533.1 putative iron-sulpher cluster proteins NifU [Fluoribacter gormanii]MCW8443879.1 iron-sulfur cluster assembly scaffold protein [Fluoribacter gormanii]SIQ44182.1 nitrogen fixation protein NifU [Fluoribacter gormanii]STO24561.1 scaffold protein [Fluoribacter gormanii]